MLVSKTNINDHPKHKVLKHRYLEMQSVEGVERNSSMKSTKVKDIMEFDDVNFCEEIDKLCPVLSESLKGAQGSIHQDSLRAKICRTTVHGALFKGIPGSQTIFSISKHISLKTIKIVVKMTKTYCELLYEFAFLS